MSPQSVTRANMFGGSFSFNCSEFQITTPAPLGTQQGTDHCLLSWGLAAVMSINFSSWKVSSTRRKGKGRATDAHSKEETVSQETLPRHGCSPSMGHRGCIALAQSKASVLFFCPSHNIPYTEIACHLTEWAGVQIWDGWEKAFPAGKGLLAA